MNRSNFTVKPSSERISVTLKTAHRTGEGEEIELPLKMLVVGNFHGESDDIPLAERTPVNIDKIRFNTVMHDVGPRLKATVANPLSSEPENDSPNDKQEPELDLDICFRCIDDFHPDNIIRQVPSLDRLFRLRELLIDLKQFPDRSQQILQQITELAMS